MTLTVETTRGATDTAVEVFTPEGPPDGTVTGRLVDYRGRAVTHGSVFLSGENTGSAERELDDNGEFSLEVPSGSEYALVYTQFWDKRDDEVPDHHNLGLFTPDPDLSLGTRQLPKGYDVEITVENPEGEDVTDETDLWLVQGPGPGEIAGVGGGIQEGVSMVELHGESEIGAALNHGERETPSDHEEVTVTGPTSVTVTLEGYGGSAALGERTGPGGTGR
ncbi:MAG: hypothetical protein ABEJ30_08035 [Halorientalis sp.]